jgi:DNA processing protein
MVYTTPTELLPAAFPASLSPLLQIPQPPKSLWVEGTLPADHMVLLTVVGSRNHSTYGKQAVDYLIGGLTGYPVGIISGLAIGTDGLAHEAALAAGLYTMSVPGSGIGNGVIYPSRHRALARKIIESGGSLLSEYPPDMGAALWTFPQRNRIMAGLARATLLIEASEKSGTLITARMAVDYNRTSWSSLATSFPRTLMGCTSSSSSAPHPLPHPRTSSMLCASLPKNARPPCTLTSLQRKRAYLNSCPNPATATSLSASWAYPPAKPLPFL